MSIDEKTVFEHSLKSITAADFSEIIVVLGKEAERLEKLIPKILVPLYEGVKGNPVLFDKDYRKEILEHTQPNGCSQIVKQNSKKTHFFETNNLRFTLDIDTKADFDKWTNAK